MCAASAAVPAVPAADWRFGGLQMHAASAQPRLVAAMSASAGCQLIAPPCCAVRCCGLCPQDYFDQSLDEIKLLRYVNNADPDDEHHIVRLYEFFYYKVCSIKIQKKGL